MCHRWYYSFYQVVKGGWSRGQGVGGEENLVWLVSGGIGGAGGCGAVKTGAIRVVGGLHVFSRTWGCWGAAGDVWLFSVWVVSVMGWFRVASTVYGTGISITQHVFLVLLSGGRLVRCGRLWVGVAVRCWTGGWARGIYPQYFPL